MTTEASPATETTDPIIPAADTPAPGADQVTTADAIAPSSSADTPNDAKPDAPKSLLDVVKSVVKPVDPATPAPSAGKDGQEAPKPDAAKAEDGKEAPEAEVPFHNHPRWQAMLKERDALKEPAENYKKITGYMAEVGLSPPEVAEGFEIMGLLKSGAIADLTKARDWFSERLTALDLHLGRTLPADLQTKVDDGLMDIEAAKELAQARANSSHLERQATARTEREAEERTASAAAQVSVAMAEAVNAWETATKAKDPDYAAKAKLIEDQVRAIVQRVGRPPATAEEATNLAAMAYKAVNEAIKPFAPKPRAVIPSAASLSARVSAAPTTLAEAVRFAVKK